MMHQRRPAGRLLFLLALGTSAWNACRAQQWIMSPVTHHKYALTPPALWLQAEQYAVSREAHLVAINDEAEQVWLTETFGHLGWVWIGLTDDAQEGRWEWTTGEPVTYTNWNAGEPNNYDNEDYVVMNWDWPGAWNDLGPASSEWRARQGIMEQDHPLSPTDLECEFTVESVVVLTWTNRSYYDTIEITAGGEVVGQLAQGTGGFVDESPPVGTVAYAVTGIADGSRSRPATCDVVVYTGSFIRGDPNDDRAVNIADAIFILYALFMDNAQGLSCRDAADVNADLRINIADAIVLLGYLMADEAPPPFPFPACDLLPEGAERLGCERSEACP